MTGTGLKGIRYLFAGRPVVALFPDGSGLRRSDYVTDDGDRYTIYETRSGPDEPWGRPICHYWRNPYREN